MKNKIISDLFNGKNFNDCIKKMEPEHLREDLRQEVILKICELPEEKIIRLHERKELEFYTVRVIINELRNPNNSFAKKYRLIVHELTDHEVADNIETEERELREMVEDLAIKEVGNLYWYNKELIELYVKHSNYRAIEEETGIPFGSCYKTIKKSLKEIKEKVKKPGLLDQVSLNRLNLINTKEYLNAS